MFQSVNESIEDEQLNATLPRLPGYREYDEVNSTSVETVQLNDGSNTPPAYKKVGTSIVLAKQPWKFWETRRGEEVHWKPITLRAPILGGFVVFSLTIIVLLEVLAHISSGNGNSNGGGLAFAADVNNLPPFATFGYLYLPTIISVLYSMTWSWVDLDVKRLEPWFQLSRSGGASAKDSLLLQYPFDFLPFVPITAGRRKHWGVFLAGTIMLLVFWIITPLQSAIFNTATATRTITSHMGDTGALIPIESQTGALNANFLNTAYGISWLGQNLPVFTTSEYAVLPFGPVPNLTSASASERWLTKTDAYGTNLTCNPANVTLSGLTYTFDNGKGCSVPGIALPDAHHISQISQANADTLSSDYMVLYVGYYDNPEVDYALQNPNCSAEHSNNFLALYAAAATRTAIGVYSNLTALFCEPSYFVNEMKVTVNASDRAVVNNDPGVVKTNGSAILRDIFNTTNFEYILATGVTSSSVLADYPDSVVLEQYPRLLGYNLTWPVSNMVGFAVALNPFSVSELAEPSKLQGAFEKAHQLLFTSAFSTMTTTIDDPDKNIRSGIRQDTLGAIIMVRSISIIVEVTFGVIAILTVSLWYYTRRRPSNLKTDLSSISDLMSMVQESNLPLGSFRDDGTVTMSALENSLSTTTFLLNADPKIRKSGSGLTYIQSEANNDTCVPQLRALSQSLDKRDFSPVRPKELKLPVALIFTFFLFAAIGLLAFLRIWSSKKDGISLPTQNTIVLSILENYLPTAFATFLEPFWVILNRLLCLLQPFDELRKGHAKPSASIEVKYTSLPPQLVAFRALKSRHFLLAAVCFVAVSTNILAVALSGLLFESPTAVTFPTSASQNLLPSFNGTPINTVRAGILYADHFYVARSNLSEGTSLPPWVDTNNFYLPFDIPVAPLGSTSGTPLQTQGFKATTTGFSANVSCVQLLSGGYSDSVLFQTSQDGQNIQFSTSHSTSNGSIIECVHPRGPSHTANDTSIQINKYTGEYSALEVIQTMQPANSTDGSGFCEAMLLVGWVRGEASNNSVESTFLSCTQQLQVAQYDVFVDSNGYIINSTQNGQYAEDIPSYFSGNSSENELFQQSSTLISPAIVGDFVWHNESFTSDWMNSLLEIMEGGSSDLVNPTSPVPNAAEIAPMVEKLYRQLFAILLGLNNHVFTEPQEPTTMVVEIRSLESRLFVSSVMFSISVVVLALHLIVAIVYYTHRPKRFLPRMPTCIASIIAYVAASRAVQEMKKAQVDDRDLRYGYGRFIGPDGKSHVGIEHQRYVVPLKSRNPAVQRKRWRWRREDKDEKQPQTWI